LNLVGLDEDNSILLEDSDAESFSFNEEDNEYYSDYDSEEDDSEEEDDEIDEGTGARTPPPGRQEPVAFGPPVTPGGTRRRSNAPC